MDDPWIYETPDGGHTVYRRKFHTYEKELVSVSEEKKREQEIEALWAKWIPILRASRNDTELYEMLQKAEMYYQLKKS